MNESINLVEILKNFPKGTKLYSTIYGNVEFDYIESDCEYPIAIRIPKYDTYKTLTFDGRIHRDYDGECTLFPSKEQRDWGKWVFSNKPKFNPKTLKPFDKILVKGNKKDCVWKCSLHSHFDANYRYAFCANTGIYKMCIPYNDETKHLVGTTEEAPEYYKYWED